MGDRGIFFCFIESNLSILVENCFSRELGPKASITLIRLFKGLNPEELQLPVQSIGTSVLNFKNQKLSSLPLLAGERGLLLSVCCLLVLFIVDISDLYKQFASCYRLYRSASLTIDLQISWIQICKSLDAELIIMH